MGPEETQQFCLRWHNYQNTLLATLPQLLNGNDLTDVTLCAGGRNVNAHKVVLSVCSQYFKDLFKELGNLQHPVIVLPGVDYNDLCALVTFMYSGEVNIYQAQLGSLLSIADTLRIRGLAEFTGGPNNTESQQNKSKRLRTDEKLEAFAKLKKYSDTAQLTETIMRDFLSDWSLPQEDDVNTTEQVAQDLSKRVQTKTKESPEVTSNEQQTPEIPFTKTEALPSDLSTSQTTLSSTSVSINSSESRQEGGKLRYSKVYATCFVCGKQLSNQYNLRVHMETHQNAHYACSACNHVSRSRDALRKHISYRHLPQKRLQP
nr:PREDICTED: longitudinals lacking protein, isoforms H/M/V-like [Bemisia tabaci]